MSGVDPFEAMSVADLEPIDSEQARGLWLEVESLFDQHQKTVEWPDSDNTGVLRAELNESDPAYPLTCSYRRDDEHGLTFIKIKCNLEAGTLAYSAKGQLPFRDDSFGVLRELTLMVSGDDDAPLETPSPIETVARNAHELSDTEEAEQMVLDAFGFYRSMGMVQQSTQSPEYEIDSTNTHVGEIIAKLRLALSSLPPVVNPNIWLEREVASGRVISIDTCIDEESGRRSIFIEDDGTGPDDAAYYVLSLLNDGTPVVEYPDPESSEWPEEPKVITRDIAVDIRKRLALFNNAPH